MFGNLGCMKQVLALVWVLQWGLPLFLIGLTLAWTSRRPMARRVRWPLTGLFVLYLIGIAILLTAWPDDL